MKKNFAFTIAEIMITLTVVGIISAIVLPAALHNKPDENVMKFKKAHNTLYQVIRNLITSTKYCDGDLGYRPNPDDGGCGDNKIQILNWPPELYRANQTYFCKTIADLLSAKRVNCIQEASWDYDHILLSNESIYNVPIEQVDDGEGGTRYKATLGAVTSSTIQSAKEYMDTACKKRAKIMGSQIVTTDDTVYYETSSKTEFGVQHIGPSDDNGLADIIHARYFAPPGKPPVFSDEKGFDVAYKIFCIDVDGIPGTASADDCVNECPFGYGIRADGKIMPGARASEWLKKDIQGEGQ